MEVISAIIKKATAKHPYKMAVSKLRIYESFHNLSKLISAHKIRYSCLCIQRLAGFVTQFCDVFIEI